MKKLMKKIKLYNYKNKLKKINLVISKKKLINKFRSLLIHSNKK